MKRHWRTTVFGLLAIILGFWSFYLHWLYDQSLYFNIFYNEISSIGLIFAGWIGIHSADYKDINKIYNICQ